MIVLLVSECSKQALVETRRIIDQFAERKGERTWQTPITEQGLATLRKMLRQTAKRNTAVACHRVRGVNRTELLWIVGNVRKFNEQGAVPTNITQRDMVFGRDENAWRTLEDILLMAGLAAFFHDFGKGNSLFAQKLRAAQGDKYSEPYRHEWLSLRLFQALVNGRSDREWLEKLSEITADDEKKLLEQLVKDGMDQGGNPFKTLRTPVARTVAWLILSHHRLPKWPETRDKSGAPRLGHIKDWLDSQKFGPAWNSPQCPDHVCSEAVGKNVWKFDDGTPVRSQTWREKVRKLAVRALKSQDILCDDLNGMVDAFTLHLSRLALMLADHYYSAHEVTPAWQDNKYRAYANTNRLTKELHQKLDEHLIGVAYGVTFFAKRLPALRTTLPAITSHKGFKKRSSDPQFHWQDRAFELARSLKDRSATNGFFGVNMASTGCGKTLANGRIMYGLANEKFGCRFSVALGLRTLTLQTGDALRRRLGLDEDDLAVLIGSSAVSRLHEYHQQQEIVPGSESGEELLDENQYVHYEGALAQGPLRDWLARNPGLHRLVSAPILVSTIDHLIPATEAERGGKQIAPMLRLLTSDLVLDEPDDFDPDDLPAMCRLVNWAGMLGARMVISSATLPPALVKALFEAYAAGRRTFQRVNGEPGREFKVCCAWFDEKGLAQSDHAEARTLIEAHRAFVQKRVANLLRAEPVRQAALLRVEAASEPEAAIRTIARVVQGAIHGLHREHSQTDPETGKRVSIGLVRMANINPMVAMAKLLLATSSPDNHRVHYCVYHSQHPLAVRSAMERQLDNALKRHNPLDIWRQPAIRQALANYPEDQHLFVVLATPVAEIGRDHDYDWAIAEPSSMRSLIQLAGRILRHRRQVPRTPNLLILDHNYRALIGQSPAFTKPGFESAQFRLASYDLGQLLEKEQYEIITSIPRITERPEAAVNRNLADMEHAHLAARLFGGPMGEFKECAALWWQHAAHWSFELQRRMPFRRSAPDEEYVLQVDNENQPPVFNIVDDRGVLKPCDRNFFRIEPVIESGVSLWGENDLAAIIAQIAEDLDMDIGLACRKFGTIRLRRTDKRWYYHPILGVHGTLEKDFDS